MPVAGSHVPWVWHWSRTVQTTGLAPMHTPKVHVSACVQASPSSHAEPLALGGVVQTPVAGLQAPASWHWSKAEQTTGAPPAQAPAWQVSPCVHLLPSSQVAPSATGLTAHVPTMGSQAATCWHAAATGHVTGLPPTQPPFWPASVWVHASPSSHAEPLAFAGLEHSPFAGLQVPAVWSARRSPCRSRGSRRRTCRPGTCRSVCRRCRRSTTSP